jgi:hypothetical protein
METIAAILGAFLLAGYIQMHENVHVLPPASDSGRLERLLKLPHSEFEDVVSTYIAAPVGKEVVWTTPKE